MSDSTSKRDGKLRESLLSLEVVLVVSSISAAVVFLFGMAFHP
jgi:hypothetical protein